MATNLVSRANELVYILNGSNPSAIQAASTEFNAIRARAEGWTVGVGLLEAQDANIKFYGALILQIKLNQQGRSLSIEDADHVRSVLLNAVSQTSKVGAPTHVQRKVCSALAAYFVHAPRTWISAISDVIQRLCEQYPASSSTADLTPYLSLDQSGVVLQLATVLAEDISKPLSSASDDKRLEDCFKANTENIVLVMQHLLSFDHASNHVKPFEDAMACFAACCCYGHKRWQYDESALSILTSMTDIATDYLKHSPAAAQAALNAFATIIDQCLNFLPSERLLSLWQYICQHLPSKLLNESDSTLTTPPDEEYTAILKLIPVVGQCLISRLLNNPRDPSTRQIYTILRRITLLTGYPGDADDLLSPTCNFWIEYAEQVSYGEGLESNNATDRINEGYGNLLETIRFFFEVFRPAALAALEDGTWSEDENWSQALADILEILAETANLPGSQLSTYVLTNILQAVSAQNWKDLGFALSAALAIADNATPDEKLLEAVFESPLLIVMTDSQEAVPTLTAKHILRFVVECQEYLKIRTTALLYTLERMLAIMDHFATGSPDLSDQAARCISVLCSTARSALTANLEQLSNVCMNALHSSVATLYQKEKIVEALSYVIEALPSAKAKLAPLKGMIGLVRQEIERSASLLDQGSSESGLLKGVTALQILAAIGKGLQSRVGDSFVDLSDDEVRRRDPRQLNNDASQVWQGEEGQALQREILYCLSHVDRLQESGDAIDTTCTILRVGITEENPGLFVFPPTTIASFLQMMHLNMPRVEAMLTTACAFTSAASRRIRSESDAQALTAIFQAVANLISELSDPSQDPQVAQLCNEFLERMTIKHVDLIFSSGPERQLAMIFTFVLASLNGNAPMLKRASASLLSAFMDRTGARSTQILTPEMKTYIDSFLQQLAPLLASVLINQISGQAQRSELDSCSKVLRAFIVSRPMAKGSLEAALMSEGIDDGGDSANANGRVTDADKRAWLQKIVMLRGGAQTNVIVKEFWAACRGTVASF